MLDSIKKAYLPPYLSKEGESEILIYQGHISVFIADQKNVKHELCGEGDMYIFLISGISMRFRMVSTDPSVSQLNAVRCTTAFLRIRDSSIEMEVSIDFCAIKSHEDIRLEGRMLRRTYPEFLIDNKFDKTIIFHVFNFGFDKLLESRRYKLPESYLYVHNCATILKNKCFEWEILEVPKHKLLGTKNDQSKRISPHNQKITHFSQLRLLSPEQVTWEMIEHESQTLSFFLSFLAGSWVAVTLPVIRDKENNIVQEPWEASQCRVRYASSLCRCNVTPEQLPVLFENFSCLVKSETWSISLLRSMEWYLNANTNPVESIEASIISVQAALELLSWTYFCRQENMSESEFKKKMGAAKLKIEGLLSSMNLSENLPDSLKEIISTTNDDNKALTGPGLFCKVRNDITHPREQTDYWQRPAMDRFNILSLGLFYLENVLMKLMGVEDYQSSRMDRLNIR